MCTAQKRYIMTSFADLGLNPSLLKAVTAAGYETPTPIQAETIPALLDGEDLVGISQTGGGKTAAFLLPILHQLAALGDRAKPGMPRALILAPTRELAMQIGESVKTYAKFIGLRQCTVFGGAPYRTQEHILKRGADILVATPGRLQDHMKRGNIYLDETMFFVLDEADRMLDMGFVDDVRNIAKHIRSDHQSIMFSATFEPEIRALAETLLEDPVHIEIARKQGVADNIDHKILFTKMGDKKDLLLHMLDTANPAKAIIFTRTRRDAEDVCFLLKKHKFRVDAIHGDKNQRVREKVIKGFKSGKYDFLVATDVAARGIDVKDITHVFNMDTPIETENYIHRVGRTARGGGAGVAYTFCDRGEQGLLAAIERLLKEKIDVYEDHPYHLPPEKRASSNRRKARNDKRRKRFDARGPRRGHPAEKRIRNKQEGRKKTESEWNPVETASTEARQDKPRQDKSRQDKPRRKGPKDPKAAVKHTAGKSKTPKAKRSTRKPGPGKRHAATQERPAKKSSHRKGPSRPKTVASDKKQSSGGGAGRLKRKN